MWQFMLGLSSLTITLCILSTIFFLLNFLIFDKFAYLLFVYTKKLFFLGVFFSTTFTVVNLHKLNTNQH
jgi:hypothetical protein